MDVKETYTVSYALNFAGENFPVFFAATGSVMVFFEDRRRQIVMNV